MENEKKIEEQFASLPLEEKVSSLFKMELATISEAISYVVKEPMKVAERLGDFITEIGKKVEAEFKDARKGSNERPPADKKKPGKKSGGTSEASNDSASA